MNRVAVSAILLIVLLTGSAPGEDRTFQAPTVDGKRLDICLDWGARCGQPAADAWCKTQGFDGARAWTPANDIGGQTPTIVLNGRRVCDQPFCDGFETITCTRAAQPSAAPPPDTEPPSPGPKPAPAESAANPWTTQDVIDPRIDEQAQYALMRMFMGDEAERTDASNILTAVKSGALAGIYQQDQGVPAKRAIKLGIGWWQLLPPASAKPRIDGTCVREPAGDPPLIVMRKGAQSNKAAYDWALRDAWSSCGVQSTGPVRPYKVTLPAKQPPAKEGPCPLPSGAEGHQEIYVVVTANERSVPGAIVEVRGSEGIPEIVTADKIGVAHLEVARPQILTITARVPEGFGPTPWAKDDKTLFVPTDKVVQVLPGCIHTVGIELTPIRPGDLR